MKSIKREIKLCLACMEIHEVDTVEVEDTEIFKGEEVSFQALYEYCSRSDQLIEQEEMIKANSLAMKDAYRIKVGLLTSNEIIEIRNQYGVSQKDFSEILDWGKATITRYENHQVQDRAHDAVLRKIDSDPKWFLDMLEQAKERITIKAYQKYYRIGAAQFKEKQNQYLLESIEAIYAEFENKEITGGVSLNLQKVVEMINYLASKVTSLHKVKLMKMLWYSDALHYKREGKAISGLVYSALSMGAVPEGYDQIVMLGGVEFDTVAYGDHIGYKFKSALDFEVKELSQTEREAMDAVVSAVGELKAEEIVEKIHDEEAYQCTGKNCIISYSFSKNLSIS